MRNEYEAVSLDETATFEKSVDSSGSRVRERLFNLIEHVSRLAGPAAFIAALGCIAWWLLT